MVASIEQLEKIKRWTYDDYAQLPNDRGFIYQLIDGELIMSPAPFTIHQHIVMELSTLLNIHIRANKLGKLFGAPYDVVLSENDVVQPDILYISHNRLNIVTKTNIQGAPDLVIEIISPASDRIDRIRKRALYARFGVPYYWIIDPRLGTVEEFALANDDYQTISELGATQTFTSRCFPGLQIALSELFVSF